MKWYVSRVGKNIYFFKFFLPIVYIFQGSYESYFIVVSKETLQFCRLILKVIYPSIDQVYTSTCNCRYWGHKLAAYISSIYKSDLRIYLFSAEFYLGGVLVYLFISWTTDVVRKDHYWDWARESYDMHITNQVSCIYIIVKTTSIFG